MNIIKALAVAVLAVATLSLGACASKQQQPAPVTTGVTK